MPELAAIVCTHTPRHLRWTLLGLATQSRPADRVVVACDGVVPEVSAVVAQSANEFGLSVTLVERPHAGVARLAQIRNNAVRSLWRSGLSHDSVLTFFDGDVFATPAVLSLHDAQLTGVGRRRSADFTISGRIELTSDQTEQMQESVATQRKMVITPTRTQMRTLRREHRRAERDRILRSLGLHRLGLVKPHKPKILGANFGVTLRAFQAVNGFDERFEGYGQEDDDFARRLHRAGFRASVIIADAINLHRWHPTRAPTEWSASPTVAMLQAPAPSRCLEGLDNPRPQGDLIVTEFGRRPNQTHAPT